jgi:hypothetical protein
VGLYQRGHELPHKVGGVWREIMRGVLVGELEESELEESWCWCWCWCRCWCCCKKVTILLFLGGCG